MKGFSPLIFADHRIEYIVSLRQYFFSRMNISWLTNVQQNLRPSKITTYTVHSKSTLMDMIINTTVQDIHQLSIFIGCASFSVTVFSCFTIVGGSSP